MLEDADPPLNVQRGRGEVVPLTKGPVTLWLEECSLICSRLYFGVIPAKTCQRVLANSPRIPLTSAVATIPKPTQTGAFCDLMESSVSARAAFRRRRTDAQRFPAY